MDNLSANFCPLSPQAFALYTLISSLSERPPVLSFICLFHIHLVYLKDCELAVESASGKPCAMCAQYQAHIRSSKPGLT